jgi:uncharacterized membrane protein
VREDEIAGPSHPPRPPWSLSGHDLSRLLSLSDGVFAFALTLLVLGLVLPAAPYDLATVLRKLQPAFIAYFLSFWVIGTWWLSHQSLFTYIPKYDRVLLRVNLLFLLFIAVMPFFTVVLAGATTTLSVQVYAVDQIGAGGTLALLWRYAQGKGGLVNPTLPPSWIRYLTLTTGIPVVIFAASIPIAFLSPQVAEFTWAGVFVLYFGTRGWHRRANG